MVQRKDCTTGNHAQALAYHGGQLNIPVTVVMPIVAPIMKVYTREAESTPEREREPK
jgi:threonine dehydratase